jgi:glucosamine-phosphate N-acetyltransferase
VVQGQKLGLRVIQALVGVGERLGCYKTILDCSAENVGASQQQPRVLHSRG